MLGNKNLLVAILALLASLVASLPSYCDQLQIPPCFLQVPRDILFLVDGSNSMNVDRFYGNVLNYTLILFCAFDESQNNKAGMILFNSRVEVLIPLEQYTRNQWYEKVWEVKNSRYGPTPACCSCCTPTADALQLAHTHFEARVQKEVQLTFVITDGVPSNNNANTGGDPQWWWVDAKTGFNPAVYNTQSVPAMATQLKNSGRRVIFVGVPNLDNVAPDSKYFNGGYANGYKLCLSRSNVEFCDRYYTDPPNFPIVSLPVAQNSFRVTDWEDPSVLTKIIDSVCYVEPTKLPTALPTSQAPTSKSPTQVPTTLAPTSKNPTKLPTVPPTLAPTTAFPTELPTKSPTRPVLDQVDLTFVVDRSRSMTYTQPAESCAKILDSFPSSRGEHAEPCWELWVLYMTNQIHDMLKIQAGENENRELGWASSFPDTSLPAKGLRVNIIGFWCTNNQRTPKQYDFTFEMNGGPITSEAELINMMRFLKDEVVPFGGTCPHLAIEQAIKNIESTDSLKHPLQTVILMTDGVFYDGEATPMATMGLREYKVLRYAIGISIAQENNRYGMTLEEIQTQRMQLSTFVSNDPKYFYNLVNGWEGLLGVTQTITTSLPAYYFGNIGGSPIPRFTWCGFRRRHNCETLQWRKGNCKWTGDLDGQYGCSRIKK